MKVNTYIVLVSILILAFFITGCGKNKTPLDRLIVATSIQPFAGFIEKIGGEKVEVMVMVPAGADPHTYEPKPSQMKALSDASMYVSVAAGLEFELVYMEKLVAINPDMLVVKGSQGIELIAGTEHESEVSVAGSSNPHTWLSPKLAMQIIRTICNGLIQVDPGNQSFYEHNRDIYLDEISQLDKDISTGLASVQNRRFMVVHPAWTYFAREYNLEEIAIEVDGKEPSAQSMAQLIDEAIAFNIKVVFASPQFNQKSAKSIAQAIGGRVVLADNLARDYVPNMRYVFGEMQAAME
jgi:zinc transport system substrate-binding protein